MRSHDPSDKVDVARGCPKTTKVGAVTPLRVMLILLGFVAISLWLLIVVAHFITKFW